VTAVIDHAYLDGECSGEGRKRSKGVHLKVRGQVTHTLGKVIHRATLTGILFARFGEKATYRRASGGAGFVTEVDSDHLWRKGEPRAFELETRPLDAVYCLYEPDSLVAGLHLSAETPLGESVDFVVWAQDLSWGLLSGAATQATASLGAKTRLDSAFASPLLPLGATAQVEFVRRGRAWIQVASAAGWIPMAKLRGVGVVSPATRPALLTASWSDGQFSFRFADATRRDGRVTGRLEITNGGSRRGRCTTNLVRLAHSGGTASPARVASELPERCKALEPGAMASGAVDFEVPEMATILAVGLRRGAHAPLSVPRGAP